ncbi:MAG: sulfatase [Candidatus Methylomirabilales bacterium]
MLPEDDRNGKRARMGRPNVVLITIDSLRGGFVGCFSEDAKNARLTENIDRWSREAVRFGKAYSQGANSSPSFLALLSGCYPSKFGDWYGIMSGERTTVAEILNMNGYYTCAFNPNPNTSSLFNYQKGFDYFRDYLGPSGGRRKRAGASLVGLIKSVYTKPYVGAQAVTDDVLGWLREEREVNPFFLWVHYMDVHGPYFSGKDGKLKDIVAAMWLWQKAISWPERIGHREKEKLVSAYSEEVKYTDYHVGRVLEAIDATNTVVIVASDHGELLGEHGYYGHQLVLYDEILHVPLVIRFPSCMNVTPGFVELNVGLIDLVPTVVDLLEIKQETSFGGSSLMPIIRNEHGVWIEKDIISEISRKYMCVRRRNWKLTVDYDAGKKWLVDVENDPSEEKDLSEMNPEIVESLESRLLEHRQKNQRIGGPRENWTEVHKEITSQLRALGYVRQKRGKMEL